MIQIMKVIQEKNIYLKRVEYSNRYIKTKNILLILILGNYQNIIKFIHHYLNHR
ncbi:unnamed protein product [Paramecium sonneborni]|uniref:Uncharacterized protein n=1 Tax=Paramecium sonneborni TaxID=65129 RepID=A0A8S1K9L4_9CILI|nr:unnamed protein product [Paramecium sonneborni]